MMARAARKLGTQKRSLSAENISRALPELGREAKALVALAFRNGPIEDVHAGKRCPTCHGKKQFSHITQAEMREIMKTAVDRLYTFLVVKQSDHDAYEGLLNFGELYTREWDEPALSKNF
jgi:hypothetical protein